MVADIVLVDEANKVDMHFFKTILLPYLKVGFVHLLAVSSHVAGTENILSALNSKLYDSLSYNIQFTCDECFKRTGKLVCKHYRRNKPPWVQSSGLVDLFEADEDVAIEMSGLVASIQAAPCFPPRLVDELFTSDPCTLNYRGEECFIVISIDPHAGNLTFTETPQSFTAISVACCPGYAWMGGDEIISSEMADVYPRLLAIIRWLRRETSFCRKSTIYIDAEFNGTSWPSTLHYTMRNQNLERIVFLNSGTNKTGVHTDIQYKNKMVQNLVVNVFYIQYWDEAYTPHEGGIEYIKDRIKKQLGRLVMYETKKRENGNMLYRITGKNSVKEADDMAFIFLKNMYTLNQFFGANDRSKMLRNNT